MTDGGGGEIFSSNGRLCFIAVIQIICWDSAKFIIVYVTDRGINFVLSL